MSVAHTSYEVFMNMWIKTYIQHKFIIILNLNLKRNIKEYKFKIFAINFFKVITI